MGGGVPVAAVEGRVIVDVDVETIVVFKGPNLSIAVEMLAGLVSVGADCVMACSAPSYGRVSDMSVRVNSAE